MLFTRKLITKFIPNFVNITDEKFTQAINALGMEIESITKYPNINNVVIGQIESFRPIEGTHLNLCQVKVNATQTNTIVCGASHLKAGAKVLVALTGAKLPNGLVIQKRTIHGLESNGMICAYSELTNNDACVADVEKDEIIMLDEGEVGSSKWQSLIGLDDTIYDVTVPANRNDENSYLVFCYELAHKLNLRFNVNLKSIINNVTDVTQRMDVNRDVCNFLGFLDYNIGLEQTSRSNWEMKSLLMNHGIKPINQMLDRLAFITLLTNCPTHVYDIEKLHGHMSCKLSNGELKFVALNGKTYTLANNDILICDETQPVSIAAIIGSENTKLSSRTTKARIEVGNFNFAQIRKSSIRLNCETDASKKASRPLSTFLNLVTVQLIRKYFGTPTKQTIWYKETWNNKRITLNYKTLSWFINETLSKGFVVSSLKKLGYENNVLFPNKFKAPAWRLDVSNQEDLFEDILKIIDVNKLKPIAIGDNLLPLANNQEYDLKQAIKDILVNNCFSEVKTYNLVNKNILQKFNMFNIQNPIHIISNNSNREYFRCNLLDGMLKVYKYNDARKLDLCPIFEMQKLFNNTSKWTNVTCLSLDKYIIDPITGSKIDTNINYYKSIVNQIANVLNAKVSFNTVQIEPLYNNEGIEIIYNNAVIGYIGKIKASALKDYDLSNKQIYVLSLEIDKMLANYRKPKFIVKQFGVFQRLSKDVNIILDKANIHLVNKKIEQIKKIKDVADAKIISIFNKNDKTIYTIRYYLVDTRQFTANDLENITKQIENLGSL
ncbi:MAG: phenylalanine--tRNA ligase subunit beta [Mycoplasma sp.]|nr:phenylalanine--tRNA ligase subunit beta [Candidatus Hennigella equi]